LSAAKSSMLCRQGYPRPCNGLLEAALCCGERLLETAVRHAGQSSWVCLNYVGGRDLGAEDRQYRIGIISDDLYQGLLGVAMFLAYLYKISRKMEYKSLSLEAINLALFRLKNVKDNKSSSAYSGLAGYIYVLMHLSSVFQREDLLQTALSQLDDLAQLIEDDSSVDIISGNSGCIPVLLGLSALRPESRAMKLARRCGDRILALSEPGTHPGGLCWPSLPIQRGFAHGLSGIAWALSELAHATAEEKYLKACRSALAEERELLSDGQLTDPDYARQVAWCHGAPGIALSRLRIYKRHGDPEDREEALAALRFVLHSPESSDSVLCHGSIGNLEPLLIAAETFPTDREEWLAKTKKGSQHILSEINKVGWKSNLCPHLIELGLMSGLSGIGYGMLRLLAPAEVPSVLLLDPPVLGHTTLHP